MRSTGFSLVEVLIALFVFSMGSVAILGLLTVLLRYSKESWEETRVAQITRQIVDDLSPRNGRMAFVKRGSGYLMGDGQDIEEIDWSALMSGSNASKDYTVWYNASGVPIGPNDTDAERRFEARIVLQREKDRQLVQVQVSLAPNASASSIFPPISPAPASGSPGGSDGTAPHHDPAGALHFFCKVAVPGVANPSPASTATAMK